MVRLRKFIPPALHRCLLWSALCGLVAAPICHGLERQPWDGGAIPLEPAAGPWVLEEAFPALGYMPAIVGFAVPPGQTRRIVLLGMGGVAHEVSLGSGGAGGGPVTNRVFLDLSQRVFFEQEAARPGGPGTRALPSTGFPASRCRRAGTGYRTPRPRRCSSTSPIRGPTTTEAASPSVRTAACICRSGMAASGRTGSPSASMPVSSGASCGSMSTASPAISRPTPGSGSTRRPIPSRPTIPSSGSPGTKSGGGSSGTGRTRRPCAPSSSRWVCAIPGSSASTRSPASFGATTSASARGRRSTGSVPAGTTDGPRGRARCRRPIRPSRACRCPSSSTPTSPAGRRSRPAGSIAARATPRSTGPTSSPTGRGTSACSVPACRGNRRSSGSPTFPG